MLSSEGILPGFSHCEDFGAVSVRQPHERQGRISAGGTKLTMNQTRHRLEFRQANDPDTSVEQLTILAEHDDEEIRGAVAMNATATDSVLSVLQMQPASRHVTECLSKRAVLGISATKGALH